MWMRGLKRACSGHHKPLLTSRPMWARGLKPVVEVAVVEVEDESVLLDLIKIRTRLGLGSRRLGIPNLHDLARKGR